MSSETMNWTAQNVEYAIEALRGSETVREAVTFLSDYFNVPVTPSSLRKALKRNGYDSPSTYLAQPELREASVEPDAPHEDPDWRFYEEEDDEPKYYTEREARDGLDEDPDIFLIDSKSRHRAYWRRSDNQYVFLIDYSRSRRATDGHVRVFDIPANQIQWICDNYTYAGKGKTQKTICRELGVVFEREMQHETFVFILQALGIDKNSLPVAPHRYLPEVDEEVTSIVNSIRVKKEAEVELKKRETDLDWYKSRVDDLQDRVFKLGEFHQLFEDVMDQEIKVTLDGFDGLGDRDLQYGKSVWSSYASDMHFGKVFKPEEASMYLEINQKVLNARVPTYIDALHKASKRAYGDVDQVLYQGLGDNFEAIFANMRQGQYFTMDSLGFEQFMMGVSAHIKIIEAHLEIFPESSLTALFIGGNHDRMMADKAMNTELFVNAVMAERIAFHFTNEDRVNVICGAPVTSVKIGGFNFISQHGHLNSWEKNAKRQEVIGAHGLEPARDKIILSEGHFHQTQYYSGTRHKYYRNSSWCGPDDYAIYQLNKTAPAECAFLECTDNSVIMHGPIVM